MKKTYLRSPGATVFMILLFSAVSAMLFGCATGEKTSVEPSSENLIQTLLVAPFKNQNALRGENATYRCSLCGGTFTTDTVEDGAETFITDTIVEILDARHIVTLIPNDRIDVVHAELLLDYESKPENLTLLIDIGKKLGADAVLSGSVYKFKQRAGGDYSADAPASVGVDLDLIDTNTARLIWHARFDESQGYLFDNLLKLGTFIKRGGKWATAEELSVTGLTDILERSPIP